MAKDYTRVGFAVGTVVPVLLFGLVGCAASPGSEEAFEEKRIDLSDGRTVTCIVYNDYNDGTELSCDWLSISGQPEAVDTDE